MQQQKKHSNISNIMFSYEQKIIVFDSDIIKYNQMLHNVKYNQIQNTQSHKIIW